LLCIGRVTRHKRVKRCDFSQIEPTQVELVVLR